MRGPRAIPDSEYRWESIQQVAREMDLKLDPDAGDPHRRGRWSMKTGQHPMAPEIGYEPMQALLESTRDFTAVFCFNDIAAIGRHPRAERRGAECAGRRFRGGIRRYSLGGLRNAFAHHGAPAAGRDGPARREGSAGADRRPKESVSIGIIMEPELIVRESTGPAKNGIESGTQLQIRGIQLQADGKPAADVDLRVRSPQ